MLINPTGYYGVNGFLRFLNLRFNNILYMVFNPIHGSQYNSNMQHVIVLLLRLFLILIFVIISIKVLVLCGTLGADHTINTVICILSSKAINTLLLVSSLVKSLSLTIYAAVRSLLMTAVAGKTSLSTVFSFVAELFYTAIDSNVAKCIHIFFGSSWYSTIAHIAPITACTEYLFNSNVFLVTNYAITQLFEISACWYDSIFDFMVSVLTYLGFIPRAAIKKEVNPFEHYTTVWDGAT